MKLNKTLIVGLAMAMLMTACGNASSSVAPSSAASTASASSESSAAPTEKSVTLKMGTKMSADSMEGKAFQKFVDLVKEKSNGSITVDIYPSEALGNAATQVTNLALGTQDIYAEGANNWNNYTNTLNAALIPFLYTSAENYTEMMQGDYGKEQEAALEAANFKQLCTNRNWLRGPYRVICSTVPVNSLDDVKNLKLRTHEYDAYQTCWNKLGASTMVVNWSETYLALQQGVVNGVVSPISSVEDMKFYEVAPYITEIDEFPQEIFVMMNLKTFNSLSAAQQQALIDAANEAAEWSNSQLDKNVSDSIARMKEAGATYTKIDNKPFNEALKEYYLTLEDKGTLPAGTLKAIGY